MLSLNKAMTIALFLCTFTIGTSSTLNCGGKTVEDCKTEFSKLYDEDFKRVYIESFIKKYFTAYVKAGRELINELPKDTQWTEAAEVVCDQMTTDFEKLDENIDNNEELFKIVKRIMSHEDLKMFDAKYAGMTQYAEKFEKVNEKYKLRKLMEKYFMDMLDEVVKMWIEIYAGLREKDLKENATYEKINTKMLNAQTKMELEGKMFEFLDAFHIIRDKFDEPFIQFLQDVYFWY